MEFHKQQYIYRLLQDVVEHFTESSNQLPLYRYKPCNNHSYVADNIIDHQHILFLKNSQASNHKHNQASNAALIPLVEQFILCPTQLDRVLDPLIYHKTKPFVDLSLIKYQHFHSGWTSTVIGDRFELGFSQLSLLFTRKNTRFK